MISVAEASERIADLLGRPTARAVPLGEAAGLVLAEEVVAGRDLPGFDNSAMDGFAVYARDTRGATQEQPVALPVAGVIAAGSGGEQPLAPGSAVRIMTGAPLPPGADAVVEVEATEMAGDSVRLGVEVDPGRSIRRAGEDTRRGDIALPAGTWLGPPQLARLAALGATAPRCVPRPRVAVIATGDELVDPGVTPGPGQVVDIVSIAIGAAVEGTGASLLDVRRAADTEADVRRAFADARDAGADLVVSVGGVSMGQYDHVRHVLEADGELDFWRVAMRPGKPLAVGRLEGTVVIGLPGNPVSALVGFEVYVLPAIMTLSGRPGWSRPRVTATLDAPLDSPPGMRNFIRARVRPDGNARLATPLAGQGSHHLRTMASANALLDIPEEIEAMPAGAPVRAILLEHPPGPAWNG
ncbi:MAG: molybdopterin molybdotransferase MoeA [Candidatus Dormibacteria bacterium]